MDKLRFHSIDHIVMQTIDVPQTSKFYTEILGMTCNQFQPPTGGSSTPSLHFGAQRRSIYMTPDHLFGHMPKTQLQAVLIYVFTQQPISDWRADILLIIGIMIEHGPVRKTNANGPLLSIYIRDPDGNLIEIANYI